MEVKIKDREKEVEHLRMALAMSEFGVNYQHADLINMVVKETQTLGDKFSLADGARILYKWKSKWEIYEYEQKKKDLEDNK